MLAPLWIQRDLRLISPNYFAVFSEPHYRWHIRKWIGLNYIPKLGSITNWQLRSVLILEVRKEDHIGNDIGYQDLDMRVIETIREGLYHARNMKQLIQKVDQANDKREENFSKTQEELARDMATRIWHKMREKDFFYGGN